MPDNDLNQKMINARYEWVPEQLEQIYLIDNRVQDNSEIVENLDYDAVLEVVEGSTTRLAHTSVMIGKTAVENQFPGRVVIKFVESGDVVPPVAQAIQRHGIFRFDDTLKIEGAPGIVTGGVLTLKEVSDEEINALMEPRS